MSVFKTTDSKEMLFLPELRFKNFSGEFKLISLSDISEIKKGKGILKSELSDETGKYDCIHYSEITNKTMPFFNSTTLKTNNFYEILSSGNDVLINFVAYSGIFMSSSLKKRGVIIGDAIIVIKINEKYNSDYISLVLNNNENKRLISKNSDGMVVQKVSHNFFKKMKLLIVENREEQNKIVIFFKKIINKIEVQNRILKNDKNFFDFLINNTFKNFSKNNFKTSLGNLIKETSNRNKEDKINLVLSVNKTLGLVSQNENFKNRVIASEDKINYKIVEKENFAYNPARINIGSIAMLRNFNLGLVSPMYITFKAKEDKALPLYLNYFFKTSFFNLEVKKRLEGSVRTLLKFNDLKDIEIPLLKLKDQENISILFEKIERKIKIDSLLEKQFENIKTFLLDNMFN